MPLLNPKSDSLSRLHPWWKRALVMLVAGMIVGLPLAFAFGQTTTGDKAAVPAARKERLNQWRGSSLGMSIIGFAPGKYYIGKIREGLAAEKAGIRPGDHLLRVGDVDLRIKSKADLKEYLQSVPPNTKLEVLVRRKSADPRLPSESDPSKKRNSGNQSRQDKGPNEQQNERSANQPTDPERRAFEFKLVTDSPAMLDGWMVAERLQQNRVISEFLKEQGASAKLDRLREKILRLVKQSKSPRAAYEKINQQIDELGVSHTAIIPSWGYARLTNQAKGGLGLTLQRIRSAGAARYFVIDLEPGGPADCSALKIGDEIVSANDVPLDRSARLILAGEEQHHQLFLLSADNKESIRLQYKQTQDQTPKALELTSDPNLNALSASKSSLRVIDFQGRKFGFYRVWNLMSMKVDGYLQEALDGEFKDCDGLIIDLRGRGGAIPVVLRIERTIKESGLPVAVIIDRHSRSAKEILAIRLKQTEGIKLVGQTTCGAVTAASFAKLPSGNALMFPVTSGQRLSRYTKDINLEGRGVEPDVQVQFDLPYLQGQDPLLKAAQQQLLKLTRKINLEMGPLQLAH